MQAASTVVDDVIMAGRDALGLLNGLRKVASAFCTEAGSEVEQVVNSQALRSLVESVWLFTGLGEEGRGKGWSKWSDDSGVMEFPDWDSFGKSDPFAKFAGLPENFPLVSSASMAYPYTTGFSGGATPTSSDATPTPTAFTAAGSSRPPFSQSKANFPPPFGRNGSNRSYHSGAWLRPLVLRKLNPPKIALACCPDLQTRWLHQYPPLHYTNDSVIGSGTPRATQERSKSADASGSTKARAQPKV